MNKREAKIIALKDAALMIDSSLGSGYPYNQDFPELSDCDLEKIVAALQDVMEKLRDRAERLEG